MINRDESTPYRYEIKQPRSGRVIGRIQISVFEGREPLEQRFGTMLDRISLSLDCSVGVLENVEIFSRRDRRKGHGTTALQKVDREFRKLGVVTGLLKLGWTDRKIELEEARARGFAFYGKAGWKTVPIVGLESGWMVRDFS